MPSSYMIEVRTGGDTKSELRNIIYDVSDRFNVHAAAKPRAVPHITLFGPYNTDQGYEVKDTITEVLGKYDVVPYKIEGFDHFRDDVIYADVVPSPEFRDLRRELSSKLRPLCYNYQPHDSDFFYDFHITIAFKDIDRKFDDIYGYVDENYDLRQKGYVTRVSNLNGRDIMWEYDIVADELMSQKAATSKGAWERTNQALAELSDDDDHDGLSPKPSSKLVRYKKMLRKKLLRYKEMLRKKILS